MCTALDQVGFGSFWSNPDLSRSYGSLRCDLSFSNSNWNPSCRKSARSEIPDFTSMDSIFQKMTFFRGKSLLDAMFGLHPEAEKKILDMARARGKHGLLQNFFLFLIIFFTSISFELSM
jgi:hypothetical protein